MPGLINTAKAAQPVDPQIVQRVVMAATTALNQQDIEQQIIQVVKSSQDPVKGLAQALLFLMKALYEKSNGTIPKQAIGPAALQVLGIIAKMCKSAGVLQNVTPDILKQAMMTAMQMLRSQPPAQPAAPVPASAATAPAQQAPVGV